MQLRGDVLGYDQSCLLTHAVRRPRHVRIHATGRTRVGATSRACGLHSPSFDTLKVLRHFEAHGFTQAQAEALVASLREVGDAMYAHAWRMQALRRLMHIWQES
jgi:hypothetical protein